MTVLNSRTEAPRRAIGPRHIAESDLEAADEGFRGGIFGRLGCELAMPAEEKVLLVGVE